MDASSSRRGAAALLVLLCCGTLEAADPPAAARPSATIEELWKEGEAAFEAGDLEAAREAFQEALARDRGRARSWNYAGGVLYNRGDLPGALEHFSRAVELDPRDPRASNNLATAWLALGDYARAEESYLQALRADPGYALTYSNLGLLYARRLGRPDDARTSWLRFLELVPEGEAADAVRRELEFLATPAAPSGAPEPAAR